MFMPDSNLDSEKYAHSPGAIYHALSDEKFILPSKFVVPRSPSLPTISRLPRSRSRSRIVSPWYSPRPSHSHGRSRTFAYMPPSSPAVSPHRSRSPPLEGNRHRPTVHSGADTYGSPGSELEERASPKSHKLVPSLEFATLPSDSPERRAASARFFLETNLTLPKL